MSLNEPTKRHSNSEDTKIIKKQKKSLNYINTINITKDTNLTDVPITYKQAINCNDKDQWINAMKLEIDNFYNNRIMVFVRKLPHGITRATTKWVYTIKKDGLGNVIRYKARLVARGFTQKKGIDYDLAYSPTFFPTLHSKP